MKGIIIGAGIGGLSTANARRSHGIDVDVFESARELSPFGAGILVPPNAMAVLARYGVTARIQEK